MQWFNGMMNVILAAGENGAESADAGSGAWLERAFYGNELWRFGLLLLVILTTLVAGRIVRFLIERAAKQMQARRTPQLMDLFLKSVARPASLAILAGGVYFARLTMKFALTDGAEGFSRGIYDFWGQLSSALAAVSVAYLLYKLVDIVEYYLMRLAAKSSSGLGTMLVPALRKGIRIFIVVVAALFIADNIFGQDVGTILAAAGIGGLAFALAAQDTVANLFGSVAIFADRPFDVGERIKVNGYDGPVESVGLRSTRIRTLEGHQVSVPNSKIVNEMLENIGRRKYIRRLANISITYDTPPDKVEKAVQIIKDILADVPEINVDPELPPRVFFNDFADYYLNILVLYWFQPPDYWEFQACSEKINMAIMRAYEAEGIEFAFPTQTLYVNKEGQ